MIHIKPETILLKGSKVVTVKSSKRSKAHKRKIKTSDKPKDVKFNSTYLDLFEKKIKSQDFESCAAFDENGNMVFNKDGEKDRVAFNDEERLKQKGTIFTHNHPIGHSFSPADIRWACQAAMKEMRVISKGGKKYTIKMKDGSNFSKKLWNIKIEAIYHDADNKTRTKFKNKIQCGEITSKEANADHWNNVWQLVSELCPELEYKVIK